MIQPNLGLFAECFGFGHVFADTRDGPITNPSITNAQDKSLGYTDDEIEAPRKAYQGLCSALTTGADGGNLLRAYRGMEKPSIMAQLHD